LGGNAGKAVSTAQTWKNAGFTGFFIYQSKEFSMNYKFSLRAAKAAVTLAVLFVLSTAACFAQSGSKNSNSADDLKKYLDSQPANTPDKPIKIAMKANDMMLTNIVKAINDAGKYVSLDFSGSPLKEIPRGAFRRCRSLAGITIPNGITSIEDGAFQSCISLASLTIPNSVTSIGQYAFQGCTSLTSVTFASPSKVTSIGDGAFQGCTSFTSVTIPDSINSIGPEAFNGCTSLTSVTFASPSKITSIGYLAFYSCTSLTSVIIPDSVTSIDVFAFQECINLTSITITSGGLQEIAFAGIGDLDKKYLAGGPGTYRRPTTGNGGTWTKQ
jgi:hypothetical protein